MRGWVGAWVGPPFLIGLPHYAPIGLESCVIQLQLVVLMRYVVLLAGLAGMLICEPRRETNYF